MSEGYRPRWADFDAFKKARLVKAPTEHEWTRFECIYAHYRRWAHLTGMQPRSSEAIEKSLREASKGRFFEHRGQRIYPCWVNVTAAEEEPERKKKVPSAEVALGKVRALERLSFRDVAIEKGAVLDWMEMTESERSDLKDKRVKYSTEQSSNYLVVKFAGLRRYVSTKSVEKLL